MKMTRNIALYIVFTVTVFFNQSVLGNDLGGRTAESVQSTFDKYAVEIDKNYQEILRKHPGLNLKVVFKIELDEYGKVKSCAWKEDETSHEELNTKICSVIKKMNLGAGKHTVFDYVFNFYS